MSNGVTRLEQSEKATAPKEEILGVSKTESAPNKSTVNPVTTIGKKA